MRNCSKCLILGAVLGVTSFSNAQNKLDTSDVVIEVQAVSTTTTANSDSSLKTEETVALKPNKADKKAKGSKKKSSVFGYRGSRVTAAQVIADRASRGITFRGGFDRARSIQVVSTAYDASAGNTTATGLKVSRGTVAVDPRVIPLGSHLYVEGYGEAIACDTGGAIKGRRIDVWFRSRGEALRWGRRTVRVYILQAQ